MPSSGRSSTSARTPSPVFATRPDADSCLSVNGRSAVGRLARVDGQPGEEERGERGPRALAGEAPAVQLGVEQCPEIRGLTERAAQALLGVVKTREQVRQPERWIAGNGHLPLQTRKRANLFLDTASKTASRVRSPGRIGGVPGTGRRVDCKNPSSVGDLVDAHSRWTCMPSGRPRPGLRHHRGARLPPLRPGWWPRTASTRAPARPRRDASGTGNTGTTSAPRGAPPAGTAARCRSTAPSSSVTVNDSASLDLTTGMTLEAWVNPAAARSEHLADGRRSSRPTSGMAYALYANNGGARPAGQVNIGGEQNAIGAAAAAAERVDPPRDDLRRRDAAPVRQRHAGGEQGRRPGASPVSTGAAADRRQRDLGRVLQRPDRRGADLQPRAAPPPRSRPT